MSTAALIFWKELKPGETVTEEYGETLGRGVHEFNWRYEAHRGPCGSPRELCWSGTLVTATRTVQIPY